MVESEGEEDSLVPGVEPEVSCVVVFSVVGKFDEDSTGGVAIEEDSGDVVLVEDSVEGETDSALVGSEVSFFSGSCVVLLTSGRFSVVFSGFELLSVVVGVPDSGVDFSVSGVVALEDALVVVTVGVFSSALVVDESGVTESVEDSWLVISAVDAPKGVLLIEDGVVVSMAFSRVVDKLGLVCVGASSMTGLTLLSSADSPLSVTSVEEFVVVGEEVEVTSVAFSVVIGTAVVVVNLASVQSEY